MFRRVISTLCFGTLAIGSAGLIGGCVYHHPAHEVIVVTPGEQVAPGSKVS